VSELNDFALKVANLLDAIAEAPPKTASDIGAPFHLTILEMGKLAKAKHAAMKKQALDPLTAAGGLLAGGLLGRATKGLVGRLGSYADEAAAARHTLRGSELGGQGLEMAAKHLGPLQAAEMAAAGAAIKDPAKFQAWVKKLPGVSDLAKSEKLLKEQLALKDQEIADMWSKGLIGGGLGLGGLYAGSQLAKPDSPQSNLPQIVRYG